MFQVVFHKVQIQFPSIQLYCPPVLNLGPLIQPTSSLLSSSSKSWTSDPTYFNSTVLQF